MSSSAVADIFGPSTYKCLEDKAVIDQRQVDHERLTINDVAISSGKRVLFWKY